MTSRRIVVVLLVAALVVLPAVPAVGYERDSPIEKETGGYEESDATRAATLGFGAHVLQFRALLAMNGPEWVELATAQ
jgi:hypothetical protein